MKQGSCRMLFLKFDKPGCNVIRCCMNKFLCQSCFERIFQACNLSQLASDPSLCVSISPSDVELIHLLQKRKIALTVQRRTYCRLSDWFVWPLVPKVMECDRDSLSFPYIRDPNNCLFLAKYNISFQLHFARVSGFTIDAIVCGLRKSPKESESWRNAKRAWVTSGEQACLSVVRASLLTLVFSWRFLYTYPGECEEVSIDYCSHTSSRRWNLWYWQIGKSFLATWKWLVKCVKDTVFIVLLVDLN